MNLLNRALLLSSRPSLGPCPIPHLEWAKFELAELITTNPTSSDKSSSLFLAWDPGSPGLQQCDIVFWRRSHVLELALFFSHVSPTSLFICVWICLYTILVLNCYTLVYSLDSFDISGPGCDCDD